MSDTSKPILLLPGRKTRSINIKGNGHPILVVDNFNQIGRDNFTRLALSAFQVFDKSTRDISSKLKH